MKAETGNWLGTAEYDLESARHMFATGRYLYVVFLCHLTLEKALKAMVSETTDKPAPKSHDLIYLLKRAGLSPVPRHLEFIGKVNNASIPTRYPSDIRKTVQEYTKDVANNYLRQTEEVFAWIKSHPILIE